MTTPIMTKMTGWMLTTMSLKVSAPKDEPTDKQKAFITSLCLDTLQFVPDFDTMTFTEASELIEKIMADKGEGDPPDNYDSDNDNNRWKM